MSTFTCPRCGYPLTDEQDAARQRIEQLKARYHFALDLSLVLKAARRVERNTGRITLRAVATSLFISEQHTWRGLMILEQLGYLRRVGKRSGWLLADPDSNESNAIVGG